MRTTIQVTAAALLTATTLVPVLADNRHFTFVYEAQTPKKGEFEYEQWFTWKHRSEEDPKLNVFEFRHELEYGVTDRWMLALYAPDWEIRSGRSFEDDGAHFNDIAVETIYRLSDPRTDFLGSAAYAEVKVGDELIELEPKLILQKDLGLLTIAYNLTGEMEWEGESLSNLDEHNAILQQSVGVSYEINPSWSVGAEAVHEIEWADWKHPEEDSLYLGPNLAWRHDRFWATVSPMFEVTGNSEAADFQVRLLFGIEF